MSLRAFNTIISGYAARLPGANSVQDFWRVLEDGRCTITRVGENRFDTSRFYHPEPTTPGRSATFAAGQIDDVWGFDASFFGISPREAVQIDPQQRLLLQVVWEAIEDAGLKPSDLAGTNTGVYVGASALDYHQGLLFDMPAVDIQTMTGNTLSIVANRVSYIFDLQGPSFTLDTACSSSLVALHQAVAAIESGQIDTAIVAGVNLLLSPFSFIGFSRASMLSSQGLCRAFDASGDGYVRSEGAVALVLRRDGPGVAARARILATGINADGRTAGLSLPSSPAQTSLLRSIYDDLDLSADDLAFIEAHGTGTQVGDPAEANALGQVIGRARSEVLPIGSAKTNVGHLEPVSGLVGILKSVLALQNGILPRSLHFDTPNPHIDFAALNLSVASAPVSLHGDTTHKLAGINSFGFGGTNAHTVIGEVAPWPEPKSAVADNAPLIISARSEAALRDLARGYGTLHGQPGVSPGAIADAAIRTRDLHDLRLVVLGDGDTKRAALAAFADGKPTPATVTGRSLATRGGLAFAFSGNGAQWAGMGQQAYQADGAFREAFETTDRHFMAVSGWSLVTMLFSADLDTEIGRTEIAQPLLFALQVAMVQALKQRGISPDMVIGHSVGEIAAAWCAGMLDLKTATRIIHVRSTQQEVVRHLGSMAALLLPEDEARAAIASSGLPGLELSAINSARSVTVTGPTDSIDAFARHARTNRWALRKLEIVYPFHSALVDPIEIPLRDALGTIASSPATRTFFSSVHPDSETVTPDATYWWENVRQPVRFSRAVEKLAEAGAGVIVEIGPRPLLTTYLRDTLVAVGAQANVVPSFDRPGDKTPEPEALDLVAARIIAAGASPDPDLYIGPQGSDLPSLPNYPWQTVPFVLSETDERIQGPRSWPLAGARLKADGCEWFNVIDTDLYPFLADHKVEDAVVFPAAGFLEMALRTALDWTERDTAELHDVEILRPLVLDPGKSQETKVRLSADDRVIEIFARPRLAGAEWSLHARAGFRTPAAPTIADGARPASDSAQGHSLRISHDTIYEMTRAHGLGYGETFRLADHADVLDERIAVLALRPASNHDAHRPFSLHPALADAGFHGLFALLSIRENGQTDSGFLPVRAGTVQLFDPSARPASVRITIERATPRSILASFTYLDADGELVSRLSAVRFKAVHFHLNQAGPICAYRVAARVLAGSESPLGLSSAAIAARADAAGLLADAETGFSPSDERLLLDALARSVVHHGLHEVLGTGPVSCASAADTGEIHASALPFAVHFLEELALHDLAQENDGLWQITPPDPALSADTLLSMLFETSNEHGVEAALLARLARDLPSLLRDGLPDTASAFATPGLLDAYRHESPANSVFETTLRALAEDVLGTMPEDRPVSVLFVGARRPRLAAAISERLDPRTAHMTVTDTADAPLDRLQRQWRGRSDTRFVAIDDANLPQSRGYDIVFACDSLCHAGSVTLTDIRRLMATDGHLIAVERAPSIAFDLILGCGRDWWSADAGEAAPVASLLSTKGWIHAFDGAGYISAIARTLETGLAEATLLLASAPAPAPAASQDETEPEDRRRMLILCDAAEPGRAVACALQETLATGGIDASLAAPGAETRQLSERNWSLDLDDPDAWAKNTDLAEAARHGVIDLYGAFGASQNALEAGSQRLWALTRLLNGRTRPGGPLLIVAPEGARAPACNQAPDPVQASVWAYGRVAINEFPDAEFRLLDIRKNLDPSTAALRIASEIDHLDGEREVVLDGESRLGLRIDRIDPPALEQAGTPRHDAMRLDIVQQGSLDRLTWTHATRAQPTGDAVEIVVEAAGLNFRDVMWALGLLPEEALEDGFAGPTLGMECCGRVVRVGPDARNVKPGDRVIAFAPACFSSHVLVSESGCVPAADGLTSEAAATIPVAFLTSYYALTHLAALAPGESVLIHGGAGGVGLAAIQIARHVGATVFATAGSPEKRALLAGLGVDHVLDSRSLAFADDIMRITKGKGVDVVLNSLWGEAMERSLSVLKPFGRFLELGKRDFYENTHLGLRPFRQNLSYFGIDADQLLVHQPTLAQRLLREVMQFFTDGVLHTLPYRAFEPDDAVAAFRLMQQAGHIGKIVIRPPESRAGTDTRSHPPVSLHPALAHVVVGGFGGFGAELIRRLADMGARTIAVLSRRGEEADGARELIAEMAERGVTVTGHACDVAEEAALAGTLGRIRNSCGGLSGVYHTAMVLEDTLIANLDEAALRKVLSPKIGGADLLDRLTRDDDLSHFVLFSSATTLVGNPGQANYVAANGYLEGLAAKRRAEGLPALAVAWGAISDAGYLARNADVGDKLARKLGRHALSAREALDGLAALMSEPQTDVRQAATGYARIDWAAARRDLALLATPYAERLGTDGADATGSDAAAIDLAKLLEGLDRPTAIGRICQLLGVEIGRILRIGEEEIDPARPLAEVGMDSLMALELRMAAERQFGIDIPLMSLANGATLADMAARIVDQVQSGGQEGAGLSEAARTNAMQHLGDDAFDSSEDMADVAARIEEKTQDIRSLL
ncbi:type I polyketide synthase [Stappia sp. ES.058]|uniref:type I polyketide synthase n=1 Tax=Stappia sp. ES.058 TaxID=1881061 RepID=UPI000879F50F|nr:type I polyketide synthase [Stappia sp. ES.058]SDU02293.1 Acyl transferase domain-containing protein [Stappia sp. ES.058]